MTRYVSLLKILLLLNVFQVTTWDRGWGGLTFMMHLDTYQPKCEKANAKAEDLRCTVYLPPIILDELKLVERPIAKIVQTFLEELGCPFMNRHNEIEKEKGWDFPAASIPNRPSPLPLVPRPISSSSSVRIMWGRKPDELNVLTDESIPIPTQSQASQLDSRRSSFANDGFISSLSVADEALIDIGPLRVQVSALQQADLELKEEIADLRAENADLQVEVQSLRAQGSPRKLIPMYATMPPPAQAMRWSPSPQRVLAPSLGFQHGTQSPLASPLRSHSSGQNHKSRRSDSVSVARTMSQARSVKSEVSIASFTENSEPTAFGPTTFLFLSYLNTHDALLVHEFLHRLAKEVPSQLGWESQLACHPKVGLSRAKGLADAMILDAQM